MSLGILGRRSLFEPRLFHSVGLSAHTEMFHLVTILANVAVAPSNVVLEYRLAHLDHML